MKVYWKTWVKMVKSCYSLDTMWYKRRKGVSMLIKSVLFTFMYKLLLFCSVLGLTQLCAFG